MLKGLFILIFILLSPISFAQTFDAGIIGGSILNFEESYKSRNYNNLFQIGASIKYNFSDKFPLGIGINFFYGDKNLQNVDKPNLYYQLNATLIYADFPITYRVFTYQDFSIFTGVSFGFGNLKVVEEYRGVNSTTLTGSASEFSWSMEPKIEFQYYVLKQIKFFISTGYFISTYSFENINTNNYTPIPGTEPGADLTEIVNEFNFSSIHLYLGLIYSF
jgi:hypothetical protein